MILDVHSHIIPLVDDGSRSMDESLAILAEEVRQGVGGVICTPHYREGSFVASEQEITSGFEELKKAASDAGINIDLWLGREITVDKNFKNRIKGGEVMTLAGSKYLLLEFSFDKQTDIDEVCYEVGLLGYVPVIAHAERYPYFRDYALVSAVRRGGALIQVNASSVVGHGRISERLFVKGLLKRKLVDLVASDVHFSRINKIRAAYDKVAKKDEEYAKDIFYKNAKKIICGEDDSGGNV